jgi:DNA-nicking Smr family endonuclease
VCAFLADAAARRLGCIRIVHGKGLGVLKQHVAGWLMRSDRVLAFASARRQDGGTGAVVVLLRRK